MHKHKSFKQILGKSNSALTQLRQQVTLYRQTDERIRRYLPQELREHCLGIHINDKQELVFILDNANWATHFRFMAGDLLNSLRKDPTLAGLTKIHCRVDKMKASMSKSKPPKKSQPSISQTNAHILEETANALGQDDTLGKALQRLASHVKKA